ncbi:MAG: TMEM43 family protein [Pseudomonadota bacterium]
MSDSNDLGSSITDSFTETTTKSWGSRIGESIKGVLFGLAFTIGACVLLFWNEGRAVQTERSLAEGRGLVVSADAARVDPANEGRLVHLNGEVKAGAQLRDADFNVTANALRLVRTVEMYQWKEESKSETRKTLGGGEETVTTYTYNLVWDDHRIDSSQFKRRDGHNNPPMRYQRAAMTARDATLGAYRPSDRVLALLPASQELSVDPAVVASLRGKVDGPVQVSDGKLYLGASPSEPKPGDLRITFRTVPNGPASFIGQQTGTDLFDYQTKAGDRLLMARSGLMSAPDMFKEAEDENRILTWIIRLVGVVVMFIGLLLVLRPLVVVADVVPFIGNILGAGAGLVAAVVTAVVAPLVIAIAWLWYRPLVSIIAIAIGLGVAFGLRTLAARKSAARVVQSAGTVSR